MDDRDNVGIFDVNTIANYDPDIVPFLDARVGCAFARHAQSGEFEPVAPEPGFVDAVGEPEGSRYRIKLTPRWTMALEAGFRRRNVNDDIVLLAPGRTIWASVLPHEQTKAAMMRDLKEMAPGEREAGFEDPREDILRAAYLTRCTKEGQRSWCLTSFHAAPGEYAVIAFYFDDRGMLEWALDCWKSVTFGPQPR
jgi:hypothetical protein